jgi:DNA-binding Lrp family transcriptional regulator
VVRRISKRKERRERILDILDKGKATFETILRKVGCGRETLSKDLKMLRHRGVIKRYDDLRDARIKWYEKVVRGADDRVKAEKGKYACEDIIKRLRNPVYGFKRSDDGKKTISAFISPVPGHLREEAQKDVNKIVKLGFFALNTWSLNPGRKVVAVLTLEG